MRQKTHLEFTGMVLLRLSSSSKGNNKKGIIKLSKAG